ncbi:MAG: hypothetical protein Q8R11_00035 [bacterium]|nr:hypothetical protein [bacterium]
MNEERHQGVPKRFWVLRHKPGLNLATSWTPREFLWVGLFAFVGAVFGTNLKLLKIEEQLSEQQFEPLPEPLPNRWSKTSIEGWRVRQSEELLPKGRFTASHDRAPFVTNGGEFEVDRRKTGILLSRYELPLANGKDPEPMVRAMVSLPNDKEDILLPTFSKQYRWMITFEHPDSKVIRHFHILPLPDGQLQVMPMQLTPSAT